jgi:hypothetical protein
MSWRLRVSVETIAFVVFVCGSSSTTRGFVEKEYALHGPRLSRDRG